MNITPEEVQVALDNIRQTTTKAHGLSHFWAYDMLLWGILWTAGLLAGQWLPQMIGWIFGIVIVMRLRIMAALAVLPPGTQVVFGSLKDTLQLTEGNLGAHLHKLEEAGYVTISKTFIRNKPQTYIKTTEVVRRAFAEHTIALREILDGSHQLGKNGATDGVEGQRI